MPASTAIVGGGISGLALAYSLRQRGQEAILFESSERLGGTIQTREHAGFWTETGPNTFLDREPAMAGLLASLGLLSKVRLASPAAKKRFLFVGGTLHALPTSPPAFLKSRILPLGARLRVIGELFSRRGSSEDESLAEFGRRHFGEKATSILLDAVQIGVFAGDLEQLSAVSAFPQLKEMERDHRSLILAMIKSHQKRPTDAIPGSGVTGEMASFEGGLQALISSLEESLGASIHRSVAVRSISRDGQRWVLTFAGPAHERFTADRLVLAVPAHVAAELLRPLDPQLSQELASIVYASVAVVHLGFRESELPMQPQGLGFLVPSQEGRPSLGVLFISSAFPWRAPANRVLLTCIMGGVRKPGIVKLDDERLVQLARSELKRALGIEATPCFREVVRWPRGIPQYNVGHQSRMRRIDEAVLRLPGLHLSGNAYRGVGINDCVKNAFDLAAALGTR